MPWLVSVGLGSGWFHVPGWFQPLGVVACCCQYALHALHALHALQCALQYALRALQALHALQYALAVQVTERVTHVTARVAGGAAVA